ncbi:RNA-directed DNA polymerase, eukaryota [Tanacetum coccineum]
MILGVSIEIPCLMLKIKKRVHEGKSHAIDKESPPAIVLEDDCLNAKDLTLSLMGRVKQMASLVNLRRRLVNEVLMWFKLAIWENFGYYSNSRLRRLKIHLGVCEHIHESFKIVFRGKVYWVRASEVLGGDPEFYREEEETNDQWRITMMEINGSGANNAHWMSWSTRRDLVHLRINSFRSSCFTRSGYFVIVRGVWLKSGIDLMIVVVYAPQEAKEKRMLWDYLAHVSNQWVEDEIYKFNHIQNAGLDEVPLGGSAYTWCLKSASKMSKLDRFFVSENLLSMCPNITAITLERFISDHRPILLREVRYDYGPIPFRFYRYWLEVVVLKSLFRDSWNVALITRIYASELMGNLNFIKDRIRSGSSIHGQI